MNRLLSILGICSGCTVIALVFTMVNTSIPSIQRGLGVSLTSMQWMMTVFGIINCAALVSSGRLADIYGRKRIYLFGIVCSGLAMVFGGFCQEATSLILCMSSAGLGNAILLPVSQALLVSEFPEDQRGRAIGIWAAAIASSMAAGPLIGGIITGALGWQWIFWCNAPVVLISFLLVLFFSNESKNTQDPPLVDWWGMLYLGITVSAFVLMVSEFRQLAETTLLMLALVSFIGSFLLWKHEKNFGSPIILSELVRNRIFLSASLASSCLVFYIWATFFLLPLYLQSVRHFSALTSAVAMLGITVPVAFLAPVIGKFYRASTAWLWTMGGFLILMASTFFQFLFDEESSFAFIFSATLLFGVGYSFIWGPTATAAVSIVSKHKAGISSGSFITIQEIGGTFGLAFIVSYVRNFPDLLQGYGHGMLALLAIGCAGCLCAAAMSPFFGLQPLKEVK